ncbi:MAG: chemotaxis protein CheA [Sphingomonas sp.]|nr:chemotaxis protein CheA [Sphingomonas sp.]
MNRSDPADTFRQEARDLLEALEQALLDLSQNHGDRDLVDSAFRALHTLKGSGSMFGFDEVAEFVHEFETAFDRVRKGLAPISEELVRIALNAKDHVQLLVAEPGEHAAAGTPILIALRALVADGGGESAPSMAVAEQSESGAPASGATGWHVRFQLPADAIAMGTNPMLLLDELRELGPCDIVALDDNVPPLDGLDPLGCHLAWDVTLRADVSKDAIEDVFLFLRDAMELSIEPITSADNPAASPSEPAPGAGAVEASSSARAPAAKASASLRVAAERLDELMDCVGELVIAQARLSQIASGSQDVGLTAVAEEIERLAATLRDTTMSVRMVPIGSLFGRFRRLVHDLASDLGKQVEFVTSGEETELDKTMVERLADPLVHIIRNAVDHGMELPDARRAGGKSECGTVRLTAVHSGAEVAISVSDDGAGLNAARIRAKAEEAGLIAPDAKLSDHELFQYIFHPGFSTAQEITSVSGRGVGMDVVKRAIEGLRGSIELTSKAGEGTKATLRLPLTLAIVEGMLVRVGDGRYAIPLSAVEECLELPASEVSGGSGRNFLDVRGTLVPYLRLRDLFGTDAPPDLHQKVVIVGSGDQRVGLVVDQIIGNAQTVIKSLSRLHAGIGTFSGATILGDGEVALILDVAQLVSSAEQQQRRAAGRHLGIAA